MRVIDCSAMIGYGVVNHTVVNHEGFTLVERVAEARDAGEMLAYMDYCGIESAIVGHQAMIDVTPTYGNQKLVKETAKCPERLIPSWTILPPATDEEFEPEKLFQAMQEHQVKALRAYPTTQRYFLERITMDELLSELQMRKIPLFLTPSEDYEHIYRLLEQYPRMRVIIHNYGPWSPDRFWFPLLRAYQDVYFETGDYETDGGLERMIGRFGSGRFVYGSDFPTNNIGGSLAVLRSLEISSSSREEIAHGNIERLLSEAKA